MKETSEVKKEKNTNEQKQKMSPQNRNLLIFVCIFVSFVVIFSSTLGIIMGVINAKTVVKYESTRMYEGDVIYLASVFKSSYISYLNKSGVKNVRDSEGFWSSDSGVEGKTYGDLLRAAFYEYLCGIAVKNSLYLDTKKFGKTEKNEVKAKVDKKLALLNLDKESFNALYDETLFEYDDFLSGSYLLTKADAAFATIYGSDGTAIASYTDECEKYLKTYTHVALIFLRTEDAYVFDENGQLTYDENNNVIMRDLTDEERAEREKSAESLREYIKNAEEGLGNAISPETFELYMKEKSDTDPEMMDRGYYFHPNAEITGQFYDVYPEVVKRAFEMEIGEYAEVECSDSVCFIYRYDVTAGAYADRTNVFFSDFYSDAADYSFTESIRTLSSEVVFSEKFANIDIVSIPANSKYVTKSWS